MTRLYRTICRIVDAVSRGLDRLFTRPQGGEFNPQLYRELEEAGYEFIGFTEPYDLTGKSELHRANSARRPGEQMMSDSESFKDEIERAAWNSAFEHEANDAEGGAHAEGFTKGVAWATTLTPANWMLIREDVARATYEATYVNADWWITDEQEVHRAIADAAMTAMGFRREDQWVSP